MVDALWLLAGILLGSVGVYLLLRQRITESESARREAEDRLFYGWKQDHIVPAPRTVEVKPPEPLPRELQEAVNDFESAEGKALMEQKIRGLMERGLGPVAILRELEQPKR